MRLQHDITNIVSKDDKMPLDLLTIAHVRVCTYSLLSLSLPLPFFALFLLPTYNGQTHNKEGKTRGRGTRYVGRTTMEHT